MPDQMPPDAESLRPALEGLLSSLPRVKVTPQTIGQPLIDGWYKREARYREQINSLREHIDTDHLVMVQLGRIADAAVKMLEHVSMDTDEDREFHARAVGALRSRLDEIAATMKEANEAARDIPGRYPVSADAAAKGTPWQLGVRCDGPGCGTSFEGDFIVAEDATRGERLQVVLDWAANNGWRVEWRQPVGDSLAYCPSCSAPVLPEGAGNVSALSAATGEGGEP